MNYLFRDPFQEYGQSNSPLDFSMLVCRKSKASFIRAAQFLSTSAIPALPHRVPLVGIQYFASHFTIMQAKKQAHALSKAKVYFINDNTKRTNVSVP